MFIVYLLIGLVALPYGSGPQSCNPAVVSYLVRDEKGKLLSATELKSVYEQLPKTVSDATLETGASFTDDNQTFYWPESVDWEKGRKRPALEFANAGTCTMHLTEVTLTYHHRKMHLIFNLDIARSQPDRRPVIDSLPFQEGTFALNLKGWPANPKRLIPAQRWKRIRRRA